MSKLKKWLMFFMLLFIPISIFSQNNEPNGNRFYFFSNEEIKSGFAYEQLYNLADNYKYCIYQKVMTNAYMDLLGTPITQGEARLSIDYQGPIVAFNFYGHRTILMFLFSNSDTVSFSGLPFYERPVDVKIITNEIERWFKENSVR
jgi:hypothetical protein